MKAYKQKCKKTHKTQGGRVGVEENEWDGWEMAYNDRKRTEIEVKENEMNYMDMKWKEIQ